MTTQLWCLLERILGSRGALCVEILTALRHLIFSLGFTAEERGQSLRSLISGVLAYGSNRLKNREIPASEREMKGQGRPGRFCLALRDQVGLSRHSDACYKTTEQSWQEECDVA